MTYHPVAIKTRISTIAAVLLYSGFIGTVHAIPPTTVISYSTDGRIPGIAATAASVPFGKTVLFNSMRSMDSNGNKKIKRKWSLVSKPSGSSVFIDPNSIAAKLVGLSIKPDIRGVYKIRLITWDSNGEQDDEVFTLTSANVAPQLNLESNYTALTGLPVSISPRGTTDNEGDALTYSWTLSSKPPGSGLTLGTWNGRMFRFRPDKVGDYQIIVTARDQEDSVSKTLTVKTLPGEPEGNTLQLPPGPVIYSSHINRLVLKPDYLPLLYLIHPDTLVVEQVDLPSVNGQQATRNSLVLSKNGRYAALGYNTRWDKFKDEYEQKVSVMDLSTRSLVRTVTMQTTLEKDYLAISNQGILYALQYEPYLANKNPTRIKLESRNVIANTPSVLTNLAVLSGAQDAQTAYDLRFDVADNRKQLFFMGTANVFNYSGDKITKRIFNFNFDLNALGEPVFPTSNFQYKERVGSYDTEYDPVSYCYQMVGLSKDNGKIYTGYNLFLRPFSFDTERYISYFPSNAPQNCIRNIAESPTSNQMIIIQHNFDYRILDGQTVTEQGNLQTKYGLLNSVQFTPFYTNDNKLLFWGTYPAPFLLKHN